MNFDNTYQIIKYCYCKVCREVTINITRLTDFNVSKLAHKAHDRGQEGANN